MIARKETDRDVIKARKMQIHVRHESTKDHKVQRHIRTDVIKLNYPAFLSNYLFHIN